MTSRKRDVPRPGATALKIREMKPEDGEGLRAMFGRLSEKTIYHRFHMPYPEVPAWMVAHLSNTGRYDTRSLVAVAGDEVVGHAMYVVEAGDEAEFAVVIEDGWQSRGVGKLLLFHLALEARRNGVGTFTAAVLGENRRMLGLLDAAFAEVERAAGGGVYRVRVPLSGLKPASKLDVLDVPVLSRWTEKLAS